MRHVGAIAWRELASAFTTPTAYVLIAAYLVFAGFIFFLSFGFFIQLIDQILAAQYFQILERYNLNHQVIAPAFGTFTFLLLIVIPLLTMRTFAEERANGTIELLLTSPVTSWEIVLGKYVAILALMGILIGLSALYPGLLFFYGDPGPEALQTLAGLIGLLLYSVALAAISCFISALTKSQIVAGLVGIVVGLLLILVDAAAEIGRAERLGQVLRYVGIRQHFEGPLEGVIRLEDLIYFAIVVVLFLTLARTRLESLRWPSLAVRGRTPLLAGLGVVVLAFALVGFFSGAAAWLTYMHLLAGIGLLGYAALASLPQLRQLATEEARRRGAAFRGNALAQSALLLVILGGVAWLSQRYPVTWDWTEAQLYTLTAATRDLLSEVPEDGGIEIYGFYTRGTEEQARDLVEMYGDASERVRFEFFDPNRRPDLAGLLEIRQDRVLLVCAGPCDRATGTVRVLEATEQEITRAIRSVISEQRKVYFVTGHGEGAIDDDQATGYSRIKSAMESENLVVEALLLASEEAVPADADAVVIAGPTHSILDRELQALDRYLRGGGSVAILADPIFVTNLEERVREWGIELGDDVIVDQTIDLFTGPRIGVQPVVSDYGLHPITAELANAATMFQLARSVRAAGGAEIVELARTGDGSWAETDLDQFANESRVGLDEGADRVGPVALAAARTFELEGEEPGEGRLVVVGDADFARNRYVAQVYNADFFLNIVNWLVGEESFITIERKVPRASMAHITREQFATFQVLAIFFLPEAVLMLGIVSWWRRRS